MMELNASIDSELNIPSIMTRVLFSILIIFTFPADGAYGFQQPDNDGSRTPLFELTDSSQTGIRFTNSIEEKPGYNVLESEFFFNGGGVAIGDINNDGLPDLYLTSNLNSNALYLNRGNLRFQDITGSAGVADADGWSAGVTMADINGDGYLDIYVCKSGRGSEDERRNKLFINNGDLTFTERAGEYGLDDPGYSTHSVFFDYDRDGDLDMYLVNYSVKRMSGFNIVSIRKETDPYSGDRLFRNDGGTFRDVSAESGILRNPIGFGLSATAGDINMDGWIDLYVTNDYMEKDYLYLNRGDGTFREEVEQRTTHISYFSMGSDIADFNNDAHPDIITADMLPDVYARRRTFKGPDYGKYDQLNAHGYHRQNMRNMLQMNNGDGTFTEVGRLAGIGKTDWSWATLMADLDNDGWKDLYVTNGFPRDYTDLDYLNEVLWKRFPEEISSRDSDLLYRLVRKMPEVVLKNHAFKNRGNLSFTGTGDSWGLDHPVTSTGAAYGDLDNDGDLDLVVNNINERSYLYRNRARETDGSNYLKIRLSDQNGLTFGTGAKIRITGRDGSTFFQEALPVRGYQSSMEPVLLFGLGRHERVGVEVIWNDQFRQTIPEVTVNRTLKVTKSDAERTAIDAKEDSARKMFLLLDRRKLGLDYQHEGSLEQDMIRSPLLPHTLTNTGPALARGDINSDGLPDLYIGGGKGQSAALFLQQTDGRFRPVDAPFFELHKQYQDTDALFFDADGDGDADLYVVSGGNFDSSNGSAYQDRLYINDGFGRFTHRAEALPRMESSGGTVAAADYDGDGDPDLFVGGRSLTGKYPYAPRSFLLENKNGSFTDVTGQVSSRLMQPGMVTDAIWTTIDRDRHPDLVIAGEWMPIRIFKNNGDKTLTEITESAGMANTGGLWNSLEAADLDGDGHTDLVAGNRGLNATWGASAREPAILYAGDFDGNGFIDPLITQVIDGHRYPLPDRDALLQQLPELKTEFPDYASYARATIDEILTEKQQREASLFRAHTFASTIFRNRGNDRFESYPMPRPAQIFPVYETIVADFNGDRIFDILVAGNTFGSRASEGPIAGTGTLLIGTGNFEFENRPAHATGFIATGEVRHMNLVQSPLGYLIMLARHNNSLLPYLYTGPGEREKAGRRR